MKFWDTSAIVLLGVREPHSATVKALFDADQVLVVWWATRLEGVSALVRHVREGGLSVTGERQARRVLEALAQAWIEVQPGAMVRRTAERLLAVHPLLYG